MLESQSLDEWYSGIARDGFWERRLREDSSLETDDGRHAPFVFSTPPSTEPASVPVSTVIDGAGSSVAAAAAAINPRTATVTDANVSRPLHLIGLLPSRSAASGLTWIPAASAGGLMPSRAH